jgi:hypothetical protein
MRDNVQAMYLNSAEVPCVCLLAGWISHFAQQSTLAGLSGMSAFTVALARNCSPFAVRTVLAAPPSGALARLGNAGDSMRLLFRLGGPGIFG